MGEPKAHFLCNSMKCHQAMETCCWWYMALSKLFYRQTCLHVIWKDAIWDAQAHMSLRFPMFWGPPTLSLHTCAGKSPTPSLAKPPSMVFWGFWALGGEPWRRGTRTFIADTVYLLLDTWHLSPDTWYLYLYMHLYLYLILVLLPYTLHLYLIHRYLK